jgi:DGQHR domain-containing protein
MTAKANPSEEGETKAEDREDTEYSYPALKLQQNGHVIYYTTIPVDDLFPFCFVVRFSENPEEGYQRHLDERRAVEIAEYLSTDGASIPINIVLSAQPVAELTYSRKNKQISFQRVPEAFALIDGQHRLWGYQKCSIRHRVPVAIYEGLERSTEARLFLDINNKHKGVPKELLKHVRHVAGTETEAEAHLRSLFTRLDKDEASPLHGKLNVAETTPASSRTRRLTARWAAR